MLYNLDTYTWDSYVICDVFSKKEAVFIPQKIHNIPVKYLGTSDSFTKVEYLTTFEGERLYLPNSIEDWSKCYIMHESIDIFYCGKIKDLIYMVYPNYVPTMKIYIPYEFVDDYRRLYKEERIMLENISYISIANVSYCLNYPNRRFEFNELHYIDFYENGEKIKYIPPIPEHEGYTFEGWYKEEECINKWDFDTDTITYTEEHPVTKLYAKWICF